MYPNNPEFEHRAIDLITRRQFLENSLKILLGLGYAFSGLGKVITNETLLIDPEHSKTYFEFDQQLSRQLAKLGITFKAGRFDLQELHNWGLPEIRFISTDEALWERLRVKYALYTTALVFPPSFWNDRVKHQRFLVSMPYQRLKRSVPPWLYQQNPPGTDDLIIALKGEKSPWMMWRNNFDNDILEQGLKSYYLVALSGMVHMLLGDNLEKTKALSKALFGDNASQDDLFYKALYVVTLALNGTEDRSVLTINPDHLGEIGKFIDESVGAPSLTYANFMVTLHQMREDGVALTSIRQSKIPEIMGWNLKSRYGPGPNKADPNI